MKNFFDSTDEKISEKAFSHSLIISVVSILLCIILLCSMTYAWFTAETTSAGNSIMSGNFDLEVSVIQTENGEGTAVSIVIDASENEKGVWQCTLPGKGAYTVTLERVNGSTANGYCLVTVGSDDALPTATIVDAALSENDTNPFTFTITVTEETDVYVEFEPRWGILTEPKIQNNGTIPAEAEQNPNG